MIYKYGKLNKFNKPKYGINIDQIFEITIDETDIGGYIVTFKEFMILYRRTLFTFTSNDDLRSVVKESLDRVFAYFKGHKRYDPTWESWQRRTNNIVTDLEFLLKPK